MLYPIELWGRAVINKRVMGNTKIREGTPAGQYPDRARKPSRLYCDPHSQVGAIKPQNTPESNSNAPDEKTSPV